MKAGRSATADEARAFTTYMARLFGATIIRKDQSWAMEWIAFGFDMVRKFKPGLPTGQMFLEQFATTIGTLIYLPANLTPDQEIEVVAHECQHVEQFVHGGAATGLAGGPAMWWLYLRESEALVRYEAEAYRTSLEMQLARFGLLPSLESLVFPLEGNYGIEDEGHKQLAKDLLEIGATSVVKTGRPSTKAGQAAVEFLRRTYPHLLATAERSGDL